MAKLDMNPEIREQWCKALRSGDYQQAQKDLRIRNEDGTYGYCCLGVLTDLYLKAGKPEEYQDEGNTFDVWEASTLADPVMEWAGLDGDNNPVLQDMAGEIHAASGWNDDHDADFNKIADMIDGGKS